MWWGGGLRCRALAIGIELAVGSGPVQWFEGARAGRRQGGRPCPPIGAWESLGHWWWHARGQRKARGLASCVLGHGRRCCQGEPGSLLHRSKQFGAGTSGTSKGLSVRAVSTDWGQVSLGESWRGPRQLHRSKQSSEGVESPSEPAPERLRRPVLMFYPCRACLRSQREGRGVDYGQR